MVHIDIEVPRPYLTLGILGAIAGFFVYASSAPQTDAVGGTGTQKAQIMHDAEEDVRKVREQQQVLNRREEILRADLDALEQEAIYNRDPVVIQEMSETRQRLIALINDQKAAEQEILTSLEQIWEAQGYAQLASSGSNDPNAFLHMMWPVEPTLGISAFFEDDGYEERFGMAHHAIDIPADQGSVILSAADGVIEKVADNGMGFNSLVIRHTNGFSTMYGHVSAFLVQEGQNVRAGDAVALSGGRPGTAGAGKMTTGAHVHFEVHKDGKVVDPLTYLPAL